MRRVKNVFPSSPIDFKLDNVPSALLLSTPPRPFRNGDRKKSQENFTQKKSQTKVTEKNVTDQNTFDVKNNANYTCLHINIQTFIDIVLLLENELFLK